MITKVSAVIITYNDASNLVRTLSKLYWCDEIIVVDSYSKDDTVAICRYYGCKIFYRSFKGYGDQIHFAVGKAENEWVLCLHAGDFLTQELADELKETLIEPGEYRGFTIQTRLFFMGLEFKYGKESRRQFLKLFQRKWSIVDKNSVHERIDVVGPVKKLKHFIHHYNCLDIHQYISELNYNSTLDAEADYKKREKKSLLLLYLIIPFVFIKYFFLNRNFLNGKKGFYWSVFSTFYHFNKFIKMEELKEMKRDDDDCIINTLLNRPPKGDSNFLTSVVPDRLN